jgi:C-terminal processing protease CtpA/Prc
MKYFTNNTEKEGVRFVLPVMIVAGLCLCLLACNRKEKEKDEEELSETYLVNQFIVGYINNYYLWLDDVSLKTDMFATDHFDLFEKNMYRQLDKWSYLTDDAEAMFDSYDGVEKTFGLNLIFVRIEDQPGNYAAIVKFVTPDSPAAKAGIGRGDVITHIDGAAITESNYRKLYNASSITLLFGKIENSELVLTDVVKSMTSTKMYEDPVQAYRIIESDGKRIGYLCYTGYVIDSHKRLDNVFREFKNANVEHMVLDLRYNPGGAVKTILYLNSILAPYSAVQNQSVCLREMWNGKMTEALKNEKEDLNMYFDSKVPVNMDLKQLYVLTTRSTASASEATISGLMPYLDVVQIGDTTHGKYCAAGLFRPQIRDANNKYVVDDRIPNWAMSLIIYKYANSDGFTDFSNGIPPKHLVYDEWWNYRPFGDESDPMLAKAIALITGRERTTRAGSAKLLDASSSPFREANLAVPERGGMLLPMDNREY